MMHTKRSVLRDISDVNASGCLSRSVLVGLANAGTSARLSPPRPVSEALAAMPPISASGGCQGGSVSGEATKAQELNMDLEECGMAPFLPLDRTGEAELSVCHLVAIQTLKLKAIEAELVETANDDVILMTLSEDMHPKFNELNDCWNLSCTRM